MLMLELVCILSDHVLCKATRLDEDRYYTRLFMNGFTQFADLMLSSKVQ